MKITTFLTRWRLLLLFVVAQCLSGAAWSQVGAVPYVCSNGAITYNGICPVFLEVRGTLFNDLNGNGVRDSGEAGLDGWSLTVRIPSVPDLDKTGTTASDGTFWINTSPDASQYELDIDLAAGWAASTGSATSIVFGPSDFQIGFNEPAVFFNLGFHLVDLTPGGSAGGPNGVPEPPALMLVGAGLLLSSRVLRRKATRPA